ncbi:MAG: hypothetical protein CL677_08705 [Bdellovibrionaceae bacterium]|nr:hypothetical protein [Pseudobdellovibrionaceae bacterium]|tara:strand:+ start:24979 stop:26274 length:1296 start_codon:yes stop_codon:yes gene_type:complete
MKGLFSLGAALAAFTVALGCAQKPNNYIVSDRPFYEQAPPVEPFAFFQMNDETFEIKGLATEFGNLRKDGWIDFSLVLPALTRNDLLDLQMSTIISPETDTLDLPFGKDQEVPSNVTFPRQKERYSFITITFEKPFYRFFINEPGVYKMTATHGKVKLRKMIDDAEDDKSLFEMINNFVFIGGGTRDVVVNDNMVDQDIAVNEYQFDHSIPAASPQLDPGVGILTVALSERDGLLIPTDMKSLGSQQSIEMKTLNDGAPKTLVHYMRLDDLRAQSTHLRKELFASAENSPSRTMSLAQSSLVIQESGFGEAPEFLDLVEGPLLSETALNFTPPRHLRGLEAVATRVSLQEVIVEQSEQGSFEKTTTLWAHNFEGWLGQLEKPNLDIDLDPNKTYRWSVQYFAQPTGIATHNNTLDLTHVTHITQNASDFQP